MYKFKTPIWNGEFGPVYANPALEPNANEINAARYDVLGAQLDIYDKYKIHWNIWLYKDIGVQGMIHTNPASKYMETIAGWLKRKRDLQLDAWGRYPSAEVEAVINPLCEYIDRACPTSKVQYPPNWPTERQITRIVNQIYMSGCVQDEFAALFKDMSFDDLEECARSFHFDECLQRKGLNAQLEAHAGVDEIKKDFIRPTNDRPDLGVYSYGLEQGN